MLKRLVLGLTVLSLAAAPARAADFRLPPADAAAPQLAAVPPPSDVESLNLVKTVERDIDSAEALEPEHWDLDALAATFGGDPIAAYGWVKTKTHFDPYSGVLRGALGTLSARAGNSADRARLLAALLQRMNVPVRYAHGTLDADTAAALVETAFAPVSISASAPKSELLDAIALRAARDFALLRPQLNAEADAARDGSLEQARIATSDHVWVEAEIGGVWTALDVDTAEPGKTLTVAAETMDELPDAMFQMVTLRVSAISIAEGQVSSVEPLTVTLRAAKLAGASVFLAFVANPKEGGIGGSINKVLGGGGTYVPVVYVDGEPFVGDVIPGLGAPAGGGALDLLGGEDDSDPKPELARLELKIETSSPAGPAGSATRTLLDRAPSAATIEPATVLTAMPMSESLPAVTASLHNIQVSVGPVNLRNTYALRALAVTEVVMTYSDSEKVKDLSPANLVWPLAAINATLPMAIENAIVPALNDRSDVKIFTGAPRVSILTTGVMDGPDGSPYRVSEIDLKLSGVTVLARDGAAKAAFERRLWAGILESAAETEFGLRAGQLLFDPDTTIRISASRASDQPLMRHDKADAGLDANAPRTAVAAIDAGLLVFAPAGDATAWWEIDPVSGTARAMLAPDLGGLSVRGAQRLGPGRTLTSTITNARTGLQSGRGGVVSMTGDGSRSIIHGQRGLGRAGAGGPPPNRCSGGNEYMTILGCVSLPAGWALREFYALLLVDVVVVATDIIVAMI